MRSLGWMLLLPCLSATAAKREAVEIQLLTIADWHGQLDPVFSPAGDVGGAAVLSGYWKTDRSLNPHTLILATGNSFGASPPLSSLFQEEPAVKAMNLMGFAADTLGNQNFSFGVPHLQQMVNLAVFPFVSANLTNLQGQLSGVAPYVVLEVGGVKVGVVGFTNPDAPQLVFPGRFGTVEVSDPVAAIHKARIAALHAGADVLVGLAHLGIDGTNPPAGPLLDLARKAHGFDVIFGGNTDLQYMGLAHKTLVVENLAKGRAYSRTKLTVDPRNGRVRNIAVEFVTPLASGVNPDPAMVTLLQPYRDSLGAKLDEVIGVATGLFPFENNQEQLEEVASGDLAADAIRVRYGTQLAFFNGGALRASLPSTYLPQNTGLRRATAGYAAGPPFDLVAGDVFGLLPFGNLVVTRPVTGAQLHALLEHSVSAIPAADGRFGQLSGFSFVYKASSPAGSRVMAVTLNGGSPILSNSTTYTFATNDFLHAGGDGYTMLAGGAGVFRDPMADVVIAHIKNLASVSPTLSARITQVP